MSWSLSIGAGNHHEQDGGLGDIATLHYPRALVLMSLAALLGLGLAAYGLFTAKGTSTLVVPPEDVALVNQQPMMRSDYLALLQTLYNVGLRARHSRRSAGGAGRHDP